MYRVLICVVLSLVGYVNSWPLERSLMNMEKTITNIHRSQEKLVENVTKEVTKPRLELDMNALNSLWPDDEEVDIANRFGDDIDTMEDKSMLSENSTKLLSSPPPVATDMRNDSISNVTGTNITLDHKFQSLSTILYLWDKNMKLKDKVNLTVDTTKSKKAEPSESTKEQRNTSVEPNVKPTLECNVSSEQNANSPENHATSSVNPLAKQRGVRNNKHHPHNLNDANQKPLVQEHRSTNSENNNSQTKKNASPRYISSFLIVIIASICILFSHY